MVDGGDLWVEILTIAPNTYIYSDIKIQIEISKFFFVNIN